MSTLQDFELELIEKHTPLANQLCRFFYRKGEYYSYQDLMQVAYIAMVNAARAYDPERGAQSTLVYHSIKNALARFVGRTRRKEVKKIRMFTDPPSHERPFSLSDVLEDLEPREKQIAEMLSMGISQREIRETLGINRYQFKKSEQIIRKYLANE